MDEHYSPLQNQLDDDEELGRHMDGFFGDPAHAPPPSSLDVFLLIVTWGQDISARLMDLAHSNQTSIYVLSALGGLSWVGLILDSIAGNTAIYEGPLHIFSLTGYYRLVGNNVEGSLTLIVGNDGQMIGGTVASVLIDETADVRVFFVFGRVEGVVVIPVMPST